MRLSVLNNIEDVVSRGLCCGCGACAHVQPEQFAMRDVPMHGRRPVRVDGAPPSGDAAAMRACPGHHIRGAVTTGASMARHDDAWGRVFEVWEGHATDPEIRYRGSSGGVMTALALYCLHSGMHGVLHVRSRRDHPIFNETVLSRSRDELLAGAGSRYSPSSPCERLDLIERAPAPCVFIGKPCDIAAVEHLRRERPTLDAKVGLTMAMFCGGTPSTAGTLELLRVMGIERPQELKGFRYRGHGWPGDAVATTQEGVSVAMQYEQAWGEILTKHKQWRCKVCADHSGELADLAIGDAWHLDRASNQPGASLVVVRTERGRSVLRDAMRAGAVSLREVEISAIWNAQGNLAKARGHVWGRSIGMRVLGRRPPRFDGMRTWPLWWRALTWREKAQSVLGTIRRIMAGQMDASMLTPVDPTVVAERSSTNAGNAQRQMVYRHAA